MADTGTSAGNGGATDAAKDKAQEVAGQAQEKAQEAKAKASDQVRTQVDQRSTQAGEQIKQQASDIRSVGDSLREQGKDGPAKIADQAADRAEKVGDYLHGNDADKILHDVEDLARKQPWAVVAGGIALGFAASRFLKASSAQRYEQRRSGTYDSSQGLAQLPPRTSGTGVGVGGYPDATAPLPPVTPGTASPVGSL